MARGRSTFGLERWHLRACKLWLWARCVVTVNCPRFVSWLSRADIIAVYSAIESLSRQNLDREFKTRSSSFCAGLAHRWQVVSTAPPSYFLYRSPHGGVHSLFVAGSLGTISFGCFGCRSMVEFRQSERIVV